jgi:hypothetical protein
MLFWYAAETVTPEIEQSYGEDHSGSGGDSAQRIYRPPPAFPVGITLQQRIAEDTIHGEDESSHVYEPVWHEGTGVDEEEQLYRSSLLPVPEAIRKLKGSLMEDVVRRGWEAIEFRMELERENASSSEPQ